MSASQRTKGAAFEREVCKAITAALGIKATRQLAQSRDGGDDIHVPPYRIECKRRANIAFYKWLEQCRAACRIGERPIVIARADMQQSCVILGLDDFLNMWERARMALGPKPETPGMEQAAAAFGEILEGDDVGGEGVKMRFVHPRQCYSIWFVPASILPVSPPKPGHGVSASSG